MSAARMLDPSTPIPQPPHSAGRRFGGLRSPIDPAAIPSPTLIQEEDQAVWSSQPFYTCSGQQPPLATSDYVAVDQGSSSPRFIRLTSYALPHSADVVSVSEWPLGAVIQPLAPQHPEEDPVCLIDCGEVGPARCQGCQAYVNPFVEWVSAGQKWRCNMCNAFTDVTPEYFSHLNSGGRRIDYVNRLELQRGTVDFTVTKDYYAAQPSIDLLSLQPDALPSTVKHETRQPTSLLPLMTSFLAPGTHTNPRLPAPIRFVFALDVSPASIRSGYLSSVVSILREALYGLASETDHTEAASWFPRRAGNRLAILTYDETLQFYNLSPDLRGPRLAVVSDIEEPFAPFSDDWFVDPDESRQSIEALLDSLARTFAATAVSGSATGPMIQAVLSAMSTTGGHLLVFTAEIASVGPGALRARNNVDIVNTQAEKSLFLPVDAFWPKLGEHCAQVGLAVEMFLAPHEKMDLASIGSVCEATGGRLFFHPKFSVSKHFEALRSEVKDVITSAAVYDAVVRVRCSKGFRVARFYGSFHSTDPISPSFALLSPSTAFGVKLVHSGSLIPGSIAYIQCATLYTTRFGERRVRCQNLAVDVKSLVGEYFAKADLGAGVSLLCKIAASEIGSRNLLEIKKDLVDKCAATLLAYRTNCSGASAQTQLILPEALKTLPLYTLCLLKSKALKGGYVADDVRCHHRLQLLRMPIPASLENLYPRLFALHDLDPTALMPGPDGHIVPPAPMRLSYLWMEAGGVYLIDNGEVNVLWIGGATAEVIFRDLFEVENLIDIKDGPLRALPTLISQQVRHLLDFLTYRRGRTVPFLVAKQNLDAAELEFSNLLFEDENNDGMSYTDCKSSPISSNILTEWPVVLCEIHNEIRAIMKNGRGMWSSSW